MIESKLKKKRNLDLKKKSTIESDKRNLNNVFGISLSTHWVFRGQPDRGLEESRQNKLLRKGREAMDVYGRTN